MAIADNVACGFIALQPPNRPLDDLIDHCRRCRSRHQNRCPLLDSVLVCAVSFLFSSRAISVFRWLEEVRHEGALPYFIITLLVGKLVALVAGELAPQPTKGPKVLVEFIRS